MGMPNRSSSILATMNAQTGDFVIRQARNFSMLLAALLLALPISAQSPPCKPFLMWDTVLPAYPPIARAAHMAATVRFTIEIPIQGDAKLTFLEGPSKGAWQMLVGSAHDYLSARKYGWMEGDHPKPCSYTASVEFRQSGKEVAAPNNYLRVTVEDAMHTIVEVKPTIPTVNY